MAFHLYWSALSEPVWSPEQKVSKDFAARYRIDWQRKGRSWQQRNGREAAFTALQDEIMRCIETDDGRDKTDSKQRRQPQLPSRSAAAPKARRHGLTAGRPRTENDARDALARRPHAR